LKIVDTTTIFISYFSDNQTISAEYLGIRTLPAIALYMASCEKAGRETVRAIIDGKEYTKRELRGMFPNLYGRIELDRG
jgi:hypothetical protein